MPAIDGTVTPDDVAEWLGVTVNERVDSSTNAAVQWAIERRSLSKPSELFYNASVHLGTVLYAALLYQARSTPSGFAGYEDSGSYSDSAEALYRARDLVGSDPVTA